MRGKCSGVAGCFCRENRRGKSFDGWAVGLSRFGGGAYRINVVHNGAMRAEPKTVRQSVSLPSKTALQVRAMAKTKRVSAARMLRELIENGIEVEKRKQKEFFDLAERFRGEKNAEEAKRLGDQLGRMVFGG
jgi:hypothetical protein